MLFITFTIWLTAASASADEIDALSEPLSNALSKSTVAALAQNRILTWAELRRRYLKEGNRLLRKMPGLGVKGERALRATAEFSAICRGTRLDPVYGPLSRTGLTGTTVINLESHGIWSERELRELYRAKGWRGILMIEGLADLGRREIRSLLQRPGAGCGAELTEATESAAAP